MTNGTIVSPEIAELKAENAELKKKMDGCACAEGSDVRVNWPSNYEVSGSGNYTGPSKLETVSGSLSR